MMTTRLPSLLPMGLCLLTGLLLAACGGGEGEVTSVNVEIWGPEGAAAFPDFDDSADPELLRFYAFQGNKRIAESAADFRDNQFTLPPIPYGPDSLLAVSVTNDPNDVDDRRSYASGATTVRFNAEPGVDPGVLRIFTAPIEAFTAAFGMNDDLDGTVPSEFELGSVDGGRAGFTVTELPDGRLVAIGGASVSISGGASTFSGFIDTIEVFEPAIGRWRLLTEPGCFDDPDAQLEECAVRIPTPKAFHSATLLDDGRIVIVGGLKPLDPSATEFVPVEEVHVLTFASSLEGDIEEVDSFGDSRRAFHTATPVGDGSFVIVGGIGQSYGTPRFPTEIDRLYVDGDEIVYETSEIELETGRALHATEYFSEIAGGVEHGIIIAGGRTADGVLGSTELIYLEGGELVIQPGAEMEVPRFGAAVTRLSCPGSDQQFWALAGGFTSVNGPRVLDGSNPTSRFETYIPLEFSWFDDQGDHEMSEARAFASAIHFPRSGDILVVGGIGADGAPRGDADRLVQQDPRDCADYFSEAGFIQPIGGVTPRAHAQMVRLPSYWGYIFGGANGAESLTDGFYFNNNDYSF